MKVFEEFSRVTPIGTQMHVGDYYELYVTLCHEYDPKIALAYCLNVTR